MQVAQLGKKIVYYYNGTTQDIRMGLPEHFPAPYGYEKIVCTSAREAEVWSERLRQCEKFKEEIEDQERELIEGPIRDNLRGHIHHLMSNSRNNMNREFLRKHLENYTERPNLVKTKRESYLHSEAFEQGR